MKSVEKNECIYYSVPTYITRFWTDEKGKVKYIFRGFDDEEGECDPADIFQEPVEIYDGPKDTDEFDPFLRPEMEKALTALAAGDETGLSQRNTSIYLYVITLFNVNFWQLGRSLFVLGENTELLGEYYKKGKLRHMIDVLLTTVRHTDEVEMEMTRAVEDMPLILDLKPLLVEAPGDSAFVISDSPLLFFNFLNPDNTTEPFGAEDYYGTVFITPLSPRYALCLYDSYSYKIRRENGRAVLTDDDMLLINTLLVSDFPNVAFRETMKFPSSLLPALRKKKILLKNCELSLFLLRNRALEKSKNVREYVMNVLSYDNEEHYTDFYGGLSRRALEKRLEHAYKILEDEA